MIAGRPRYDLRQWTSSIHHQHHLPFIALIITAGRPPNTGGGGETDRVLALRPDNPWEGRGGGTDGVATDMGGMTLCVGFQRMPVQVIRPSFRGCFQYWVTLMFSWHDKND